MAGNDALVAGNRETKSSRSVPIQYPMLSDTNYEVWTVKMRLILRSLDVWTAIEERGANKEKDQDAMTAIFQAIPVFVLMAIAGYPTAKEAWDALKEMRVGEDKIKRVRAQVLKRQLYKLEMTQNETIAEYSVKLINMVTEIRELRGSVTDTEVVEKLFALVTDTFTDIVGTIEQFGDVSKMTVPEIVGRLRTHEENRKGKKQMK